MKNVIVILNVPNNLKNTSAAVIVFLTTPLQKAAPLWNVVLFERLNVRVLCRHSRAAAFYRTHRCL